jgi:hypothetical protein
MPFYSSVIGVIIFSIVDSIGIETFGEKVYSSLSLHLVEMDTDPDPAKRCRSARSGYTSILRMRRVGRSQIH